MVRRQVVGLNGAKTETRKKKETTSTVEGQVFGSTWTLKQRKQTKPAYREHTYGSRHEEIRLSDLFVAQRIFLR